MGQERETSFSYSRESRVSSRESISKFEERGRGGGKGAIFGAGSQFTRPRDFFSFFLSFFISFGKREIKKIKREEGKG